MFYLGRSQYLESWAEGVTERKSLNNLGFVCLPYGRLSPGPRVFKESTLSFSYQKFALGKFSSHINASYKSSDSDSSKFPFITSFQPPYWWCVAQLFPFSIQCTVLHAGLLTLAFSPNQSASEFLRTLQSTSVWGRLMSFLLLVNRKHWWRTWYMPGPVLGTPQWTREKWLLPRGSTHSSRGETNLRRWTYDMTARELHATKHTNVEGRENDRC